MNKENKLPTAEDVLFRFVNEVVNLGDVVNAMEEHTAAHTAAFREIIEAYKECFELFISVNKWDEATEFLSSYGSGLAIDFQRREKSK